MTGRIAILALVAGFLVAPHLEALAGDGCGPCCCSRSVEDPCDAPDGPPCESVAPASCCEAAPGPGGAPPKGAGEAPSAAPQALAVRTPPPPAPLATQRFARAVAAVALPSALRLSVVLRI